MFSMVLVAFRAAEKASDRVSPPAGDWSAVRMATAQQGPPNRETWATMTG